MIMLTSTHDREMAKVIRERDEARDAAARQRDVAAANARIARRAHEKIDDLTVQLAPFKRPRKKNAKGHYTKEFLPVGAA